MVRNLSHTSFPFTTAAVVEGPRAAAWMTEAGLTMAKDPNPIALALRHAP